MLSNWHYYQGEVIADRKTVWIDLDNEDLLSTYAVRARTAVRKAVKHGVRVEWWDSARFMKLFPALYYSAMTELNASPFYYFNPEYLSKLIYWPHSCLAAATVDQDLIAAAIFLVNGDIMEYHLSASTQQGKNLCAANLILHKAGLLARQLGCRRLYLGGGTDNKPDNSLLFFKAGFSRQQASFKIGKRIHLPDQYEGMKKDWLAGQRKLPPRVLFYR